jgi:hypothetical protein
MPITRIDPDQDGVDVRAIREQLEAEAAVSGDHVEVVERVHAGELPLVADRLVRRDQITVDEFHLSAVRAGRRDLRRYRGLRHHHGRRYAGRARRPGEGPRRVAGRNRDDAVLALLGRQLKRLVEQAAHLEAAGLLEQLGLQGQPRPEFLIQRGRFHHRRPMNPPFQLRGSLANLFKCRHTPDPNRPDHRPADR